MELNSTTDLYSGNWFGREIDMRDFSSHVLHISSRVGVSSRVGASVPNTYFWYFKSGLALAMKGCSLASLSRNV